MEEIKVGDFIRTKEGYVGKIVRLGDEFSYDCIFGSGDCKYAICFHGIVKHSPNIIDLIEVGDYVNGYKVRDVYLEGERHYIKLNGLEHARIYDDDIKSIVTHESFNSNKYVIGE